MGIFKTGLVFIIIFISAYAEEAAPSQNSHILYLMQSDEIQKSISEYQKIYSQNDKADFEILQKLALILLNNGSKNQDPLIQRLSILGAGLAASSKSIDILENGIKANDMQTQLMSLFFIASLQEDKTDLILSNAMTSVFLPCRIQAAYYMAERKHAHAMGHIESLMHRLPPFVKSFFPLLFAMIGTPEATNYLKKLLYDQILDVRIETILNIARFHKDELLPFVRKKILSAHVAEQEASLFAIGLLKDSSNLSTLKRLAESSIDFVKIAALKALYNLGDLQVKSEMEELAKNHNLFAIAQLAEMSGSEDTLFSLSQSDDEQIKINAIAGLLKRKDTRALPYLKEVLLTDVRDFGFQIGVSPGRSLTYIKVVPSAAQQKNFDFGLSLSIKESILKDAQELPENLFLGICQMLYDKNQTDLIPYATALLENLHSANVVNFFKEYAQSSKFPMPRDWANLALFRLKEIGPYENYIHNWIQRQNDVDLIQLNDLSNVSHNKNEFFHLTKEEKSRLLIDMFTAIASRQNINNINVLIDALKKNSNKNRYAIAGLLARAVE